MAIKLKEIACRFEGAKELAVLVQDNRVTKPKFQLNFHDSGGKSLGGGMLNGFHGSKTSHPATSNNISLITLKAGMIAHFVRIHKEDSEWRFDG